MNIGDNSYIDGDLEIEKRYKSLLADGGLSPFSVLSKVMNVNLNADLLDGYHAIDFLRKTENPIVDGDWVFTRPPKLVITNTDLDSLATYGQVVNVAGDFNTKFDARLAIKSTTNLAEGTNLYYTDARVRAATLFGYTVGANSPLASTDTILQAFGKLQGQINALGSGANNWSFRGTYNGMDANLLVDAGWYDNGATTPSITNFPVSKQGFLQVTPYRSGVFNAVAQDFMTSGAVVDANYGRKFFRVSWNGTYSAWKEYAFRDWVIAQGYSTTIGTVTSVGLTAPTGFTVTGSPVTTSGSLALTFTAGYSLPTTAKQTAWDAMANRWIRPVVDYASIDNFTFGGVGSWGNTATNRPTPFGSSLTFVGGASTTGDQMTGSFVNTILAATTADWYVRYNLGTVYQMWTSKQFTSTDISNWNTAYSWGNPAGLYVPLARLVSTGTGLTGGGSLAANRTLSFDTTFGDARYTTSATYSQDWDQVNSDGKSKFNISSVDWPLAGTIGHGVFLSHGSNSGFGTEIVFRNGRGFWRSRESGVWGTWFEFASQAYSAANYASIGRNFTGINSVSGGGSFSVDRTFSLVNDSGSPGANMLYGTNGSGTKGWYAQPSGGGGGISGSGTAGYFPKWTGSTTLANSVMQDTGSEINIASSRSFGVEGPAAMRDYLHVWDYVAIGKSPNHGTIVVHNAASATAHASTAIDIQSTTRGLGLPIMTRAQRLAITSPRDFLMVGQAETVGASLYGIKVYMAGQWVHQEWNLGSA